MTPNPRGAMATLSLEASQQSTHQKKSLIEQKSIQKFPAQQLSNIQPKYKWRIVWRNVIAFLYLHVGALYALYIFCTETKYATTMFALLLPYISGLGITAGAHRLWAHRAYKAKLPLRIFLMILQTVAFQNCIYEWVKDHRVHHKYTDTDADPHNATRGFFFSHMGWLMVRKHPDVIKKGANIDMTDLKQDSVVNWQKRYYSILMPLFCFIIPTWIPIYFWNERLLCAWFATVFRYVFSLHSTWLVNSAAHIWGMKPYDKTIGPTENRLVSLFAIGEGWHNYHHVFPYDYKAAELGNYRLNLTTAFLDLCARWGLAYDLKVVPEDVVRKRATRTGDGSRYGAENDLHSHVDHKWGWGDVDLTPEEMQQVKILHKGD
ncbi:acyl-CoA Delta-9 desaturase-like [Calliopsis andreniformis]|uniref:acyl-CoA Delta-9 desaturase-like n=1 Tax=Calliopsis andreniformis TaxID=337506 RepID=UPI003FCD5CAF